MNPAILDPFAKLKSVASSVPEILKEFKICRQTDRQTPRRHRTDADTDCKTLPAHFMRVAGNNDLVNTMPNMQKTLLQFTILV